MPDSPTGSRGRWSVALGDRSPQRVTLGRRVVAEAIGTAFLLAAVIGSGIMGERLAGGNVAIALLANTVATGAALVALILTFGPISGAHFNPAVTLAGASQAGLPWREVPAYIVAQVAGAFAGVAAAHVMFGVPLFFASQRARAGGAQHPDAAGSSNICSASAFTTKTSHSLPSGSSTQTLSWIA